MGAPPVRIEILPTVRDHLGRFVGRGLHAPEPAKYSAHFAQVEPRHRRFGPFYSLHRCAIVCFGDVVDILRTVVIIENLAGLRKQHLHMFPYPLCSIGDDTQPHFPRRNQTRFAHLLECLAKFPFILHLVPTQEMDDAIAIEQIEAKALGVAPLAAPQGALGPLPSWSRAALPGAVGTRGHVRPIDPQHHDRTAPTPRGHLGNTPLDLVTRWRHIQDRQALSHVIGQRMHALAAQAHTRQIAK